ncbi:MAG TPA: hypothetical protein VFS00_12875, partial [Polyangiaceae bacterium]|nr:hypothetical protein [Polyangiaceae bacterium]
VEKPAAEGHVILAQWGPEYLYGGTLSPRRDGRVYLADEAAGAVAELPFVAGALALPVASGGVPARACFVLLVFTGAERPADAAEQAAARTEAIERQITVRLGRDALPDRISFFPLYPRLDQGAIDAKWCETQYRAGRLGRKAKNPAFIALTALRKAGVKDLSQAMEQ